MNLDLWRLMGPPPASSCTSHLLPWADFFGGTSAELFQRFGLSCGPINKASLFKMLHEPPWQCQSNSSTASTGQPLQAILPTMYQPLRYFMIRDSESDPRAQNPETLSTSRLLVLAPQDGPAAELKSICYLWILRFTPPAFLQDSSLS